MLSKLDKISQFLKKKNYPLTDLGLRGIGGIKKYLYADEERFVIFGSNPGEWVTYAGGILNTPVYLGGSLISWDTGISLPADGRVTLAGSSYQVENVNSNFANLSELVSKQVDSGTHALLDGYSILVQGSYQTGNKALTVISKVPVVCGDQWSIPSQYGVLQTTVTSTIKTTNTDQWDVLIQDPLDTDLKTNTKIMVQAISAVVYNHIPLEMPCWLALPITTHLQECPTPFAGYVRLMAGDRVVKTLFTPESVVEVPNVEIPSRCWSGAHISQGIFRFQESQAYFEPSQGKVAANLSFCSSFNGSEIEVWKFNLSTNFSGLLTIKVGSRSETYNLKPGIQTLLFNVPDERVFGIEIQSNVPFTLADISPKNPVNNISLSLMVFPQNYLGSHVISGPVVMDMIPDPKLIWLKVGAGRANAGFKVNPQYPRSGYFLKSYLLINLLLEKEVIDIRYTDNPVSINLGVSLTPVFEDKAGDVSYECDYGTLDQNGVYYPTIPPPTPGNDFTIVDRVKCTNLTDPSNYVEKYITLNFTSYYLP